MSLNSSFRLFTFLFEPVRETVLVKLFSTDKKLIMVAGIGHSHFASEDLTELIDSVFINTQQIRLAEQQSS